MIVCVRAIVGIKWFLYNMELQVDDDYLNDNDDYSKIVTLYIYDISGNVVGCLPI